MSTTVILLAVVALALWPKGKGKSGSPWSPTWMLDKAKKAPKPAGEPPWIASLPLRTRSAWRAWNAAGRPLPPAETAAALRDALRSSAEWSGLYEWARQFPEFKQASATVGVPAVLRLRLQLPREWPED